MKKIIRLTESDLVRLIKRVINEKMTLNEKVTFGYDYKPEDFAKQFKGKKGAWFVDNGGSITAYLEEESNFYLYITCNPQVPDPATNRINQQQGQQPTKESYLRKGKSDLDILIKRVINEGIVEELDYKPEDFAKQFKGKKGTWFINDNKIMLVVEGDTMHWYNITCNPQTNQSNQQQGQQPTKESYLRKYKKLY